MQPRALERLRRLARAYQSIALIVFNTLLVFFLLNLPFYVADFLFPEEDALARMGRRVIGTYGIEHLKTGYSGMTVEEVAQLQHETWSRLVSYEPLTEYRETPYQGRFISISTNGFRLVKDQAPWPPDPRNFNVFALGGSTTFGYGVADEQTFPSRLQEQLRPLAAGRLVCVYNFGRAAYYCTQERILFEQFLEAGLRPDLAVFMDGLNDSGFTKNGTVNSETLSHTMEHLYPRVRHSLVTVFPAVRQGQKFFIDHGWLKADPTTSPTALENPDWPGDDEQIADRVVARYLANQAMITAVAARFQVKTLFLWQPVANYHGQAERARFPIAKAPIKRCPAIYQRIDKLRTTGKLPENLIWLADMQLGRDEILYIDAFHYSPAFYGSIAAETAKCIAELGLLR